MINDVVVRWRKSELVHALAHFFNAPEIEHRPIVRAVLQRLNAIKQVMQHIFGSTFLASSFLIVSDGEQNVKADYFHRKMVVDVRIVDFLHVAFLNDNNGNPIQQLDENFRFGLHHFNKYLEMIIDDSFVYVPIDRLNHSNHQDDIKRTCCSVSA